MKSSISKVLGSIFTLFFTLLLTSIVMTYFIPQKVYAETAYTVTNYDYDGTTLTFDVSPNVNGDISFFEVDWYPSIDSVMWNNSGSGVCIEGHCSFDNLIHSQYGVCSSSIRNYDKGTVIFQFWNYSNGDYGLSQPLSWNPTYCNTVTPTPTPTSTPTPPPTPLPVTITFNASADTYVRSGNDNRNEGAEQYLNLQSSGNNRSLIRFNQSAMQSAITGDVLSAKLRLTIADNGNNWGTSGRTVDVHRLIADWIEGNGTDSVRGTGYGATWNCAIDSFIQNQAKDCSGSSLWEMAQPNNSSVHPWAQALSATQTITNNQSGVVEYDITSDVASFLNGSSTNYGWIIKKTDEGQNGQVSFGSKESSNVPQLIVTYQP
jgi:hypothetical protein